MGWTIYQPLNVQLHQARGYLALFGVQLVSDLFLCAASMPSIPKGYDLISDQYE
jgi:hypothetical protein